MRLLFAAVAAVIIQAPLAAQALKGVWKPVELIVPGNEAPGGDHAVTGLLILTENHYSLTLETFASAGTYELTDIALVLAPSVGTGTGGTPAPQAIPLRLIADSLWLTTPGWFGDAAQARLKLVRVGEAARVAARRTEPPPPVSDNAAAILGSWELNLEKSGFSPGPAPRSKQITYERTAVGIRYTATIVDSAGNTVTESWSGIEDGSDHPFAGAADFDTQSVRVTGRLRAEIIAKRGGRIALGGERVVSSNGRTLTIRLNGTNASGQVVRNELVYERR